MEALIDTLRIYMVQKRMTLFESTIITSLETIEPRKNKHQSSNDACRHACPSSQTQEPACHWEWMELLIMVLYNYPVSP